MQTASEISQTSRYAPALKASKRVQWAIETDVIQGRTLGSESKYLPDGLSLVDEMQRLSPAEKVLMSQVQGRTYANIFGLVERFINAKVLELSRTHVLGDQVALESLIRFSEDELKHQELFRRIEQLANTQMPPGYRFVPEPNAVARAVLAKSTWAVLALTLHIELFTQKHYRESIAPDPMLSPLYKDVFLFHWKEEAQHAALDEIELRRCDAVISKGERDRAVTDFIDLVVAVDGILQAQSVEDARYFAECSRREWLDADRKALHSGILKAYRWQYILSGAQHPRFLEVLGSLVDAEQSSRIMSALATLK